MSEQDKALEKASEEFQQAHSKFLATVKATASKDFLCWWLLENGYDKEWVEQSVTPLYNKYDKRAEARGREEDED